MGTRQPLEPHTEFARPLERMRDCHRRVERSLDMLLALASGGGAVLDGQQRQAALAALNHLRDETALHSADEDQSLFPRLAAAADPRVRLAMGRVRALQAEHETVHRLHDRLEELGRRWVAAGRLEPASAQELAALLGQMRAGYAAHIGAEDGEIFPLAEQVLSEDELAAIGREMAERRRPRAARAGQD